MIPCILYPEKVEIFYQLSKTVFDDTEPDGEESGLMDVSNADSILFFTNNIVFYIINRFIT